MPFSSFTDEQLLKEMENGFEKYIERAIQIEKRSITSLESETKEHNHRNEHKRWLIERTKTSLIDLEETYKRIQLLKEELEEIRYDYIQEFD